MPRYSIPAVVCMFMSPVGFPLVRIANPMYNFLIRITPYIKYLVHCSQSSKYYIDKAQKIFLFNLKVAKIGGYILGTKYYWISEGWSRGTEATKEADLI